MVLVQNYKFLKSYKLFENDLADQYRNWKQKNEEEDKNTKGNYGLV